MDDLISEFITETSESLALLDMELVKLEQNPNDEAILSNIFRIVHTIKGTCGFLGLPRLETVAHAGENVLGKIRDGEIDVNADAVSLILEALDRIKDVMEYLEENGEEPEGDDSNLINRLNKYAATGAIDGSSESVEGATPEPEPEPKEESASDEEDYSEYGEVSEEELQKLFDETDVEEGFFEKEEAEKLAKSAQVEEKEEASEEKEVVATEKPKEEAKKEERAKDIPQAVKDKAVAGGLATDAKDASKANLANQSIRVNLGILESLMQMVGELVLTRNQLMQMVRSWQENNQDHEIVNQFMGPLHQLSYITSELQESVMKTRMQPIGNAWAKFPRLIRDLSIELNKKINLIMKGEDTELDRQLLELIKDPLTHMVRNSCDHGLEGPEDRVAAGKSEEGTVILSAFHEGGHIIIEIIDDGHGINVERVRQKITENNLASESELENMSEQQIIQYIFKAGFSTAEQVTAVSGRGVGMDVVRTNIEKIGGTIELSSETGKGSTFHIKIPLTLAIVSVLVVESCGQKFALPQINVVELVRSGEDSEHIIETINDSPVLRLRDKILPLLSLERVLQLDPSENDHSEDDLLDDIFIVVCKVGGTEFGIIVDQIYDTEEIVVKPVSSMLQDIPVYSGNTILGDGSVIMILDPNGLSQETGELETQTSDDDSMAEAESESITTFLLFTVGDDAPKAVPLELVSRLEEIEAKDVETTGEYKVIQYRGDLMRLVTLDDVNVIPEEGTCEVIVFNYDNKVLGLVVENILDIVETRLDIKLASDKPDLLGSMVVNGKTTDVVDVGTLLSELVGEVTTNNTGSEEERSKNILFVEDSPFFRNLTVPFLSGVGYDVTALESAKKGLEVLEQRDDIDLIITDIEMPEMDGIQFAAVCRADASLSHIPIIAFTSTTNDNLKQNKQFDDYILKTNREDLLNAISGQLTQKREVA